jgi:3-mercaptopyruvate sulfurtransferase SseA
MRPYPGRPAVFFLIALFLTLFLSGIAFSSEAPSQSTAPQARTDTEQKAPLMTPHELKARLDTFKPTLIVDVRSPQEFSSLHIAGAMSVPLAKINSMVGVFPRDMAIVFY